MEYVEPITDMESSADLLYTTAGILRDIANEEEKVLYNKLRTLFREAVRTSTELKELVYENGRHKMQITEIKKIGLK